MPTEEVAANDKNLLSRLKEALLFYLRHPIILVFLLLLLPIAGEHLASLWHTTFPEVSCQRDTFQDYLMSRAIWSGDNPYRPIPDLIRDYGAECLASASLPFKHPAPHTALMALLTHPLAPFISFQVSFALRLLTEILAIIGFLWLLSSSQESEAPAPPLLLIAILIFASFRSFDSLHHGQVNFVLLFLCAGALALFERGKERLSGAALALISALKVVGWPILLLFIFKRRWRVVQAFVLTFLGCQALTALILGPSVLWQYWTAVIPEVSRGYMSCGTNESIWFLSQHLFEGYRTACFDVPDDGAVAQAIFPWPNLPSFFHPVFALTLLVAFIAYCLRRKSLRASYVALACLSPLVSPIAWGHAATQTFILLSTKWLPTFSQIRARPLSLLFPLGWLFLILIAPLLPTLESLRLMPLIASGKNILLFLTVSAAILSIKDGSKQ